MAAAEFIHSAATAGIFGDLSESLEAHFQLEQEASDAILAALPRPPVLASGGCDNLLCLQQGGEGAPLKACGACLVAQYCSVVCQRQCWPARFLRCHPGRCAEVVSERKAAQLRSAEPQLALPRVSDGHGDFCAKLRHAPPPLRLMHRWVSCADLVAVRATATPFAGDIPTAAITSWLSASMAGAANTHALVSDFRLVASLDPKEPAPEDAAAVQAILARLAPERLVLAVFHSWRPAAPDGDAGKPACTLFEVQLDPAAPLRGADLLKHIAAAMAYMYLEEDRLAPGGAEYAPGGTPRVGMRIPPQLAAALHYQLDARGRLVGMAPSGPPQADASSASVHVRMLPPRLRWPSPQGPFRLSSMCMEDLALQSVCFSHLDPLILMATAPGSAEKVQRLHAARSFVCAAHFEA